MCSRSANGSVRTECEKSSAGVPTGECVCAGISLRELANHLLSLAHPAVAVLLKRPNGRGLEDNHEFKINDKFSSRLVRVSLLPASVVP
jgi:hypothetical protein